MATEKEYNDVNRIIEDSAVIEQTRENPPTISSTQDETSVKHPTVLSVPLFSSQTTDTPTPAITYPQTAARDTPRVTSMSSSPEKPNQRTVPKVDRSKLEQDSVKGVPDLNKVKTPCVSGSTQKSSTSVESELVPSPQYRSLETSVRKEIPASHKNKNDLKYPKVVPVLHQPPVSSISTDVILDNEPLNLTVVNKSPEKVIASSLFGEIAKQSTVRKLCEGVSDGKTKNTSLSSIDYKVAHPIGSRKVTENIITYHEPMFQSVANTLFENQKNLMMGKRKTEEEKDKGEYSSQDCKRSKVETTNSPNKTVDGKTVVKKKCTIENIIERIRTEKTQSRGGNAQVSKPDETETESKSDENEKDKPVTVKTFKSENSANERPSEMAVSSGLKDLKKSDSKGSAQISQDKVDNEESVQKDLKQGIEIKIEKQDTPGIVGDKTQTINEVTKDTNEPKKCDSNSLKPFSSDKNPSKPKQKKAEPGSQNSKPGEKKLPKQKKAESFSKKSPESNSDTTKKKKKIEGSSPDPKQKKCEEKCEKVKDMLNGNAKEIKKENKGKKESKKALKVSRKTEDTNRLGVKGKKVSKLKDFSDEYKSSSKDNGQEDIDSDLDEKGDLIIKQTIGEKVKVKRNSQNATEKSVEGPKKRGRKRKTDTDICSKNDVDKKKISTLTKSDGRKQSAIKKKSELSAKVTKQRKQKLPIACRRVKREASLNAAMFLNILSEKSPRSSKLVTQRSKSDSDIKHMPEVSLYSSHSMTDVGSTETGTDTNLTEKGVKSPKTEKLSLFKNLGDTPKLGKQISQENNIPTKTEPKSPKKTSSPKRKVSFSDSVFEDVFEAVIQRSIDATEKDKTPEKKKRGRKPSKGTKFNVIKKKNEDGEGKTKKNQMKLKEKKEKKFRLKKIKQAIKITVNKSPEEVAEKKRKANLARMERAKEFMKTERKVSEKSQAEEKTQAEEKDSDDSVSVTSEKDESQSVDQTESESKTDEVKKIKAKKGALCRAARTHVSVESKTVVENTMPSPRWCECCQSSYYPYQQTQGTQVWRIKHLVDKDTSKSPEPIQSSSNHFIAAHARCEIRPYASPSHVSVIDSTPYVGQIVPHGHIQCSACSCGHSGVFHPGQCQNCTLGGVSNMLPCQRYGSTYSVTYPHTHGSYTHCGCGACYPAGSYHHSVGQTLIHQPQMSMSAESSILLHHPLQLQVTHDATHPVTMSPMTHTHNDSSLSHPVQPVPLHLSHSEQNLSSLTHMCQLSQGEVTNVSAMASSSPCDHEIDVGSRDDMVKSVLNISQSSNTVKQVDKVTKTVKLNKTILKEATVKIDRTSCTLKEPSVKLKRSKSCDTQIKGSIKVKDTQKIKDMSNEKLILKEKKKSSLLLIKQKQKQLEQKLKLSQKKELKGLGKLVENASTGKKVKSKLGDTKAGKKLNKSISSELQTEDKEPGKRAWHGWSWEGEGVVKKVVNIFDGQTVERKCFSAIRHEDGDLIQVKDCVLVRSGLKEKDIPFVAKVSNFWEDPYNGEMMMSVLWFYRPEHAEGGPIFGSLENEVFAAKHRDETLVACIEDKGYVLTFNEYCRFMAEVERTKSDLPPRNKVVPEPEEAYPSNRIPPVDINPENVFLCRQVYDIKLKRVLKNPS